MTYLLPYPPSANRYYRSPNTGPLAGRHLISEAGRRFREAANVAVLRQGRPVRPLSGRLWVEVLAYPPDRRRRDLDNLGKASFDALTHALVIEDDGLFDDIRFIRLGPVADGRLKVTIGNM